MSYGLRLQVSTADISTIFELQKRAARATYNRRPQELLDNLRELTS